MQVKDIMRDVEVTYANSTLLEAADRMRFLNVGALPVCDGDRIVGMITDGDISLQTIADCWDPWTITVRKAMAPFVVYCFDDHDLSEARQFMWDNQVRWLVVLDRGCHLAGIVSLDDLVNADADHCRLHSTPVASASSHLI